MSKTCASCGSSMPDNAKFCLECGHNLQDSKIDNQAVKAVSDEAKPDPQCAPAIDKAMLAPLASCLDGQPAPIDYFLYSAKGSLFLLIENTTLPELRLELSNMESVQEQFEAVLKDMYGVHIFIYNDILEYVLGKKQAQEYIISDDYGQKDFRLFLGKCEGNIRNIYNICESIKQGLAAPDNTTGEKIPQQELLKNILQELAALYDIMRKDQLELINGPVLDKLAELFNKLSENNTEQKEAIISGIQYCIEIYKYAKIRIQGIMYQLGITVPQNPVKAEELLTCAAEHNDVYACNFLGQLALNNSEDSKAVDLFARAAELGDAEGMVYLATCYQEGIGVKEDVRKAFNLFKQAADIGHPEGIYKLGICYYGGMGVKTDIEEALDLYRQAAEAGSTNAMCALAYIYQNGIDVEKDEHKAFAWFKQAADAGNTDALCSLGFCYADGVGVEKDPQRAFACYRQAAEAGSGYGMFSLGLCYQEGIGVKKDEYEAFDCFKQAADAGIAEAMFSLGCCYQDGIGVKKDNKKAISCFKQSADAGCSDGLFSLGYCYETGIGTRKNGKKAFDLYRQAADAQNIAAMHSLGYCYEFGIGVEKDLDQAIHWYRMAAEHGFEPAKEGLARLQQNYQQY